MPQELGLPKYWDFKSLDAGTQIVEKGEYIGTSQGKFGEQYRFHEHNGSNREVIISGGAVKWRVEQGHIAPGRVFDIFFEGKETLEKGNYAGKEVNNFKFMEYSRKEIEDEGLELLNAPIGGGAEEAEPEAGYAGAKTEEVGGKPLDDLD